MTTVKDMLIEKLREIGADGLYFELNEDEGCGCELDDLCPCEGFMGDTNILECVPAKKTDDGMFLPMEGGE